MYLDRKFHQLAKCSYVYQDFIWFLSINIRCIERNVGERFLVSEGVKTDSCASELYVLGTLKIERYLHQLVTCFPFTAVLWYYYIISLYLGYSVRRFKLFPTPLWPRPDVHLPRGYGKCRYLFWEGAKSTAWQLWDHEDFGIFVCQQREWRKKVIIGCPTSRKILLNKTKFMLFWKKITYSIHPFA